MPSKMSEQSDNESFIKLQGGKSDSKEDQENKNLETDNDEFNFSYHDQIPP